MRPTFLDVFHALAGGLAQRSTCRRLHVGAVLVSTDYRTVYGIGYNGNASGGVNDCDTSTPGNCGDVHAEANALLNSTARRGDAAILVLTHSPCMACSKLIVNAGNVELVSYVTEYRDTAPLLMLQRHGVATVRR